MELNYEKLLKGSWQLKGYSILHYDKVIGLLNPSILLSKNNSLNTFVAGKNGRAKSEDNNPDSIWAAIVGAGGVLFGNDEEVDEVTSLLLKETSSRTISYLCGFANSCSDLLGYYSKIKSANILILGTGGIGSITAVLLAGAGVKHITLVDGDLIEKSNLNRQLFFTKNDIGKRKVNVLKKVILDRYDDVEVEVVAKKINVSDVKSLVEGFDLTFSTLDEPATISKEIAKLREKYELKILQAGYFVLTSRVFYNYDFSREIGQPKFARGQNSIAPSYGPVNSELAGIASALIIQIICGLASDKLYMQFESNVFPRKIVSI